MEGETATARMMQLCFACCARCPRATAACCTLLPHSDGLSCSPASQTASSAPAPAPVSAAPLPAPPPPAPPAGREAGPAPAALPRHCPAPAAAGNARCSSKGNQCDSTGLCQKHMALAQPKLHCLPCLVLPPRRMAQPVLDPAKPAHLLPRAEADQVGGNVWVPHTLLDGKCGQADTLRCRRRGRGGCRLLQRRRRRVPGGRALQWWHITSRAECQVVILPGIRGLGRRCGGRRQARARARAHRRHPMLAGWQTGRQAARGAEVPHLVGEQAHAEHAGIDDAHPLLLQVRQQPAEHREHSRSVGKGEGCVGWH